MPAGKNIILIAGPTGSGKTALAVDVALHYGVPVISADSRQMYRGMAVGTAQPTAQQLAAVPHYFIASHDPEDEFTAGRFAREAVEVLNDIFKDHDLAVVAGGSGLYIDALCDGMDDIPDAGPDIRKVLSDRLRWEGLDKLLDELESKDPVYHRIVDPANAQRVVRALEVCIATGKPYSSFRKGSKQKRDFGIIKVGTILPRPTLYKRIDARVDEMIRDGLEEEARKLYPLKHLNSLQTVGYKEMFAWFEGATTLDIAIELIKRNSRRYAKRQLTWFGRDTAIQWFSPYAAAEVIAYVDRQVEENNSAGKDR